MKLYLKGARLAFTPTLFEPKIVNSKDGTSGKPKFSVASIIEPTTKVYAGEKNPDSAGGIAEKLQWNGNAREEFSKTIIAVATEKWAAKAMETLGVLKAQNRLPLHDGAEKALTPGFAGNLYMNSSSDLRPVVRHKTGASLTAADGVISPAATPTSASTSGPRTTSTANV